MPRKERAAWAVTVGHGVCPECGERPARENRPRPWPRFRYWLVNGAPAPITLACPKGHEWHGHGSVRFLRRLGGPTWLRLSVEVFRAVHVERRMQPTPLTYVIAAGVGLLLGAGLDWLVGLPWWAVAMGFVLLVWLFFMASAFRGPRGDLRNHLLRVVDPERAAARDVERLREAIGSGSLLAYGLEEWDGERSLGGWGGTPQPESIKLRHGQPGDESGWVEVTTRVGDPAEAAGHWLTDRLESRLLQSQSSPPRLEDTENLHDWHRQRREMEKAQAPAATWETASLRVDGEMVSGSCARAGEHWVAFADTGHAVLELAGHLVDPSRIALRHVVSLDRYLQDRATG